MKIKKLSKRDFAVAIKHGRGSAFLHVALYGDKGIKNILRDACVTDIRHDTFMECSRSKWLATILDRTKSIEFYANAVEKALSGKPTSDDSTYQQLVELASALFERGFNQFQSILLNQLELNDSDLLLELPESLFDVAGMWGFDAAAQMLISIGAPKAYCESYFEYLSDAAGEDEAEELIEERLAADPRFASFWSKHQLKFNTEESSDKETTKPALKRKPWTVSDALRLIADGYGAFFLWRFRNVGKNASESELNRIYLLLEEEKTGGK